MNKFQAVNQVYNNLNRYELHFHRLSHLPTKSFSTALFELQKAIAQNELQEESLLNDFVSALKKYRFYIVASLIPYNSFSSILDFEKLKLAYRRCSNLYPNILDELKTCYLAFKDLIKITENPIIEYLKGNMNTRLNTGILLKAITDVDFVKSLLESLFSNYTLVGPQALKRYLFFDQIIVIGATRWFPSFIYNSPHAPKVHTITYTWHEKKFHEMGYLEGEFVKTKIFAGRIVKFHEQSDKIHELEEFVSDTLIENTVEYGFFEQKIKDRQENLDPNKEEVVGAKLVVFNKNKGIFFEDISIKNIFSIYPEFNGFMVGNRSISELDTNTYILLRTGTKQDLVREKADKLLGEKAYGYRKLHRHWKKRLRVLVQKNGIKKVQKALLKYGVKNPSEANIRNWMSEDNIMPRLVESFKAILKLLKLTKYEDKIINASFHLRNAHKNAGRIIRELLIKEIQNTDLSILELKGEHVFNLADEKGVSFTAYRVEYVSEQTYKVPLNHLKDIIVLN